MESMQDYIYEEDEDSDEYSINSPNSIQTGMLMAPGSYAPRTVIFVFVYHLFLFFILRALMMFYECYFLITEQF